MRPEDFGLGIIPGLGPIQGPPKEYGLGQTYQANTPFPQPVRIGPVSLPVYDPSQPVPPLAPMPSRPVAGVSGNVVPFRATAPVAPETTPAASKETQQQPGAVKVPNIPIPKLTALQRKAESTNNYTATNKTTSASGAYQYTDGTWNNYGGYKRALYAPPEVQDRRFAEDIAKRVAKYNGDVFKAIADHYLPAAASRPETWTESFKLRNRGKTINVPPVANYIRHVLKGTPYEKDLDAYLAAH